MPWPNGKHRVLDYCHHFPRGVPEPLEHLPKCDAEILYVGEAPGKQENAKGIPFVGQAGFVAERALWLPVGLRRANFYITNVLAFQPPANKFEIAYSVKGFVAEAEELLRAKRAAFCGTVIVPAGNHALAALTGKKGIMKWRGSVLATAGNREQWIVPTIHPAAALRQPILLKTMRRDWQRIAGILHEGWNPPAINLVGTVWNDARLLCLLDARVLAFDIENVKGTSQILCISFCADFVNSYSIDCRHGIPEIVRQLLQLPCPKVAQNGYHDCYILRLNGVEVRNFCIDTSLLFHALDNNVGPQTQKSEGRSTIKPYSLAYMASIFTPFVYWKESAKDEGTGEDYGAWKSNWKRFQEYNAMDSLGTLWIARVLVRLLKQRGRYEWYKEQYAALIYPLLDLSLHGVRYDVVAAEREARDYSVRLGTTRKQIETLAKRPLHGVKYFKREPRLKRDRPDGLIITQCGDGSFIGEKHSLSNKELHAYLYKELRLKVQKKEGKTTADEVAIRNLLLFVKEDRKWKGNRDATRKVLEAILTFRELEKTIQFLNTESVDADGRIRAAYSLLTQTGRLRSYKNPTGSGFNLQNTQRNVRHVFVPDTAEELGCAPGTETFFLELDGKQAEDLAVKAMSAAVTGDKRPLDLVRDVWEGKVDIHRRLAATVFDLPADSINYDQRYCTKRCRHAKNNGMRDKRMQVTLLKDGYVFTLPEIRNIIARIDAAEPWVLEFHKAIRQSVMRHRSIATSWGWQLRFDDERLTDNSVFNRGYAFIEQSEIGVLLKQEGLLTYANEIAPYFHTRLNMLVHDNVVLSSPANELFDVAYILTKRLTQPRAFGVRATPADATAATATIAIPFEVKISRKLSCSCDDCKKNYPPLEFKDGLPDRKAFEKGFAKWRSATQRTE